MLPHLMERRDLLRHTCCGAAGLALSLYSPRAFAAGQATDITPDQALAMLKEGNERFLSDEPQPAQPHQKRRMDIARSQAPFAVLVGCSDSRVPPELLFGRGLGELFIIRNAGNTVDLSALGSVEYAVGPLGVPLIVVLGHERCGAVAAAVDVVVKDATFPGRIGDMVEPIIPAVLKARHAASDGVDHETLLDEAVRENVRRVANHLSISSVLEERQRAGKLKIVGARYDLDDGRVDFFHEV